MRYMRRTAALSQWRTEQLQGLPLRLLQTLLQRCLSTPESPEVEWFAFVMPSVLHCSGDIWLLLHLCLSGVDPQMHAA